MSPTVPAVIGSLGVDLKAKCFGLGLDRYDLGLEISAFVLGALVLTVLSTLVRTSLFCI